MTEFLSQTRYHDWIVKAALLPALLTLAGVAVTTIITLRTQALWNAATHGALRSDSHADDYVRGLAKLGIGKLPGCQPATPEGYEPIPAVDLVQHLTR
jgi:hypothetical protein